MEDDRRGARHTPERALIGLSQEELDQFLQVLHAAGPEGEKEIDALMAQVRIVQTN